MKKDGMQFNCFPVSDHISKLHSNSYLRRICGVPCFHQNRRSPSPKLENIFPPTRAGAISSMPFIPDDLILEILAYLDSHSLRSFGYTSKASFAFHSHEDLWKQLFLQNPPKSVHWRGTWRRTVLQIPFEKEARIHNEIVSEALVQPYLNASINLERYSKVRDTIPRFKEMGKEEFEEWYDRPFILTDEVNKWPAFKKWTVDYLLEQFPSNEATFEIEAVEWSFPTYVEYMNSNRDESPLYLFDKGFATKKTSKGTTLEQDYSIPETFREDLFTLLGNARPDHRWLIVGPQRSGSTFHKVPTLDSPHFLRCFCFVWLRGVCWGRLRLGS